jgi:hypothetical protein
MLCNCQRLIFTSLVLDIYLRFTCKTPTFSSAPGRIRTCDPRIRSPLLCPAELRAQFKDVLQKSTIRKAIPPTFERSVSST